MTGMLVTATLYLAVNGDLPTTSSLKMIDLWMLFSLAIPFLEVILHSAMAWMRQKYELENTKAGFSREVVDMNNQTDEIYQKRSRTPTSRSEVKGPVKRLIKEAIKEAVTAAALTKDDQDQPGEIDTKEPKRPNIRKIAWDQKDEITWPKSVLRYFVYYFHISIWKKILLFYDCNG